MADAKQEWIQKTLLSPYHKEQIEKWMRESKSVKILVTGKTGVGKSALINGIVGQEVAKEGETLDAETSKVTGYKLSVHGVNVEVFDSPGLQDGTKREKEYLKDMEEKCKQIDLVLYCCTMVDTRISADDKEAIQKLTDAFGIGLWENAIFVLTFANEVKPHREPNLDLCTYFMQRVSQWKEKLQELLIDNNVHKDIVNKVPVVPVGYDTEPTLPDREHWLSSLWLSCLDRVSIRAKPAFLKVNWSRLRTREEIKPDELRRKTNEQPIMFSSGTFGAMTVPLVILELLGLPPRIGTAGSLGAQMGRNMGQMVEDYVGSMGPEIGGMVGAIVGELIYQYGMTYFS